VSDPVDLGPLRASLQGVVPSPIATCAMDGTPNVTYLSIVKYVDRERVATSRQFFNKTRANLDVNPYAQVIVVDPETGRQHALDLRLLHTETDGELFEAMRADLEAVASQTGMGAVFRLRGVDVHRVERCVPLRAPRAAATAPATARDPLEALDGFVRRLALSPTYEEVTRAALEALEDLFGFDHAILLALDASADRLFAIASSGYRDSAVGAEVPVGSGPIGTAALRRRLVVQANLGRSRTMAAAVTGSAGVAHDVPLPGLPDARSAAAVPLISGAELLGVLYLESGRPGTFGGPTERVLRIVGGHLAAALAARGATGEEPEPATQHTAERPGGPPLELVYYQADDTVLCDGEYVVKGAPGRILWSMLRAHAETGRTEFSNRELRLDERIGLPAGNDNLEARLLVLRRRLAERGGDLGLERVARGRLALHVGRPAQLSVVPTAGPMRAAHHAP
jgi:adenylate cyclase